MNKISNLLEVGFYEMRNVILADYYDIEFENIVDGGHVFLKPAKSSKRTNFQNGKSETSCLGSAHDSRNPTIVITWGSSSSGFLECERTRHN